MTRKSPPHGVKLNDNKTFTLAEVLITLVIIGIIAAITVPMIMANHRKTETAARLKKFYSTMSNAIKLAETENGIPTYEWTLDNGVKLFSNNPNINNVKDFFEKYYGKYLIYTNSEIVSKNDNSYFNRCAKLLDSNEFFMVYFNDGTLMFAPSPSYLWFDVNGEKAPNEFGRDIFSFFILADDDGGSAIDLMDSIPHFNTISDLAIDWENEYKDSFRNGLYANCEEYGDFGCSYIIQNAGWEIKSDYPKRL